MTETLWFFIFVQMAMGGTDTLYHHEGTERLAWRPSQKTELRLHGWRNLAYAVLFATLGWSEPRGAFAMALIARMRTGEGTYIDCSMLQSAAAFQAAKILENYLEDGQPVVSYVPVGVMETSDGYITISAMRDAHYDALCGILGREDLARDERFNGRDKRRANKALLMPILEDEFRKKTSSEWCEALTRAGVMNARINTYLEFLAEPQVEHAGIVAMVDHGHMGVAPAVNIPGTPALGDDPAAHRCPDIGEDGDRILAELGRSRTDIQRLRTAGAVR